MYAAIAACGDQFEGAALAQVTQCDAGSLGAGAAAERRFLFRALAELSASLEQFVRVELPALVDAEQPMQFLATREPRVEHVGPIGVSNEKGRQQLSPRRVA
ncbi:hypothetical protein ACFQ9V_03055 [Leifsonia sp. NPDC056665]|uniref:hypothetical protein n=1 Tax=Leifsonia sp. NPDC056665 TaxID=3345901 RepID=UPI0036AFDC38